MQHRLLAGTAVCVTLLMISSPMPAHHGTNTEYDSDHPITVTAVVTEFLFVNPHVQIYFDVTDSKGKVTHWGVESSSPGRLVRMGWNRNSIKPGDKVTLTLEPARSGNPVGGLKKVVFPDGRALSSAGTTGETNQN